LDAKKPSGRGRGRQDQWTPEKKEKMIDNRTGASKFLNGEGGGPSIGGGGKTDSGEGVMAGRGGKGVMNNILRGKRLYREKKTPLGILSILRQKRGGGGGGGPAKEKTRSLKSPLP